MLFKKFVLACGRLIIVIESGIKHTMPLRMALKLLYLLDSITSKIFLLQTEDGNKLYFEEFYYAVNEIYKKKVYDRIFQPEKGNVVVDVGAHVGVYSLRVAKIVGPNGLVVAIEPEPRNFKMLLNHIRINNCTNIIPVNVALGATNGKIRLYISYADSSAHSTIFKRSKTFIDVPVMTFDHLMKSLSICQVDLVKIDVEGAEIEVLKGIKNIPIKKVVIAAYHYKNEEKEVAEFLRSQQYEVKIIKLENDTSFVYGVKRANPQN